MDFQDVRPESNRAVERCGERQLPTVEQDYLKTRGIEILAAEIPVGKLARMKARLVETWPIPGDLRMSAFSAEVLKTGRCWASVPDMLSEGLQPPKSGISTKRPGHILAEVPRLDSAAPRQVPIKFVVLEPMYCGRECLLR